MKKLTLLVLLAGALTAGPLKVALYPVYKFPKAEGKAIKAVVKGTYKAAKAILW